MTRPQPVDHSSTRTVLVVEHEDDAQSVVVLTLREAGYDVKVARLVEALDCVAETTPDLVIADRVKHETEGLDLLGHLRGRLETWAVPVILVTSRGSTSDMVTGLDRGADDYLVSPFHPSELLARVRARIKRPPIPRDAVLRDEQSGLLSERTVLDEIRRELARAARGGAPGCLAFLEIHELAWLKERFGMRAGAAIVKQAAAIVEANSGPLEVAGCDRGGRILILLQHTDPELAHRWLERLSRAIAGVFPIDDERLRLTPVIGMAPFETPKSVTGAAPFDSRLALEQLWRQADVALQHAASRLDLHPVRYQPSMTRPAGAPDTGRLKLSQWFRVGADVAVTMLGVLALPLGFYVLLGASGWWDPTHAVYVAIVICLVVTNAGIWVESRLAMKRKDPPETPDSPYPPASAIIAAYLPNEAATIVDTVEAFLRLEYPAPLQIVLAYNTERTLPVEATLHEIAKRDPRFVPFRVEGSMSKAQNINASLTRVTGDFVGLFDADHHPDPSSFCRAWRWLSSGCDVVQGHCLIRNGNGTWMARLIAVEYELIYALSHPGRARLHGFGIFGGSNGYWKTTVLRQTRMRHFMLTEDIDSSIRAIREGYTIVSDPWLISRELAPLTLKTLWHQRMRWAQGWFQVGLRQTGESLRSPGLTLRQKLGHVHLLVWSQCFPWVSLQILPVLAYWIWFSDEPVKWQIPLFVFTTVFTLGTGPLQTVAAYRVAHPDIKQRRSWFLFHCLMAPFYAELKNVIVRIAHVKEFNGEREWKVTPRVSQYAGEDIAGDQIPAASDETAAWQPSAMLVAPETHPDLADADQVVVSRAKETVAPTLTAQKNRARAQTPDVPPAVQPVLANGSTGADWSGVATAVSDIPPPELASPLLAVNSGITGPEASAEEALVLTYLSTRPGQRDEGVDKALWGPAASVDTVSRMYRRLSGELDVWRQRRLTGKYPYVYLDAVSLKLGRGQSRSASVLIAIGVETDGYRHVLGLAEGDADIAEVWADFLRHLENRGLTGVRLIIGPAHPHWGEAVSECFPTAACQWSASDWHRSVVKQVPSGRRDVVTGWLKAIHAQTDRESAAIEATGAAAKLTATELRVAASAVQTTVNQTLAYYAYPIAHWRHIRTNASHKVLLREIRKCARVLGAYPDRRLALMLVSARLRHVVATRWSRRRYLAAAQLRSVERQSSVAA